jgi:A/G-specific adenine glycosylase
MPGMWELPAAEPSNGNQTPMLKLRHSITTTDYSVLVFPANGCSSSATRWVPLRTAGKLPLTGLARKILCHLKMLPELHEKRKLSRASSSWG